MEFTELNDAQVEYIEDRLAEYDEDHISYKLTGSIRLGIEADGRLIAGVDATMTAFRILYVSTVFVDARYRRQGYGTLLMRELEKRAEALGANMIRLDSFNWQGKEFYEALGYEVVGSYENAEEQYAEYFFLKRLN